MRSSRSRENTPRDGSDPLSELEDVFASLKNPQPKVLGPAAVAKTGGMAQDHAGGTARCRPANVPRETALAAPQPPAASSSSTIPATTTIGPILPEQRMDAVRTRSYGPLLVAALVVAVLAGGGYGIWLNRDAFGDLLGLGAPQTAATPPAAETAPASGAAAPSGAEAPAAAAAQR